MSSAASKLARARKKALRSRNVHAERGRELTQQEVLQHARPDHLACRATTGKPAGVVFDPKRGTYSYCRCATEALIKMHPEVIIAESGPAYWPKEEGDGEDDDAGAGEPGRGPGGAGAAAGVAAGEDPEDP